MDMLALNDTATFETPGPEAEAGRRQTGVLGPAAAVPKLVERPQCRTFKTKGKLRILPVSEAVDRPALPPASRMTGRAHARTCGARATHPARCRLLSKSAPIATRTRCCSGSMSAAMAKAATPGAKAASIAVSGWTSGCRSLRPDYSITPASKTCAAIGRWNSTARPPANTRTT